MPCCEHPYYRQQKGWYSQIRFPFGKYGYKLRIDSIDELIV